MKVSVICLSDRPDLLPTLVWSLHNQTHKDWELVILDQTPTSDVCQNVNDILVQHKSQVKVRFVERIGDWGQAQKVQAAKTVATGDAFMFPNDDSYYMPRALELMSRTLAMREKDLAICAWIYGKYGYGWMPARAKIGYVDVGGFMVTRKTFERVGWQSFTQTGDGEFVEACVEMGARVALIGETLYVQN